MSLKRNVKKSEMMTFTKEDMVSGLKLKINGVEMDEEENLGCELFEI